MSNEQKNAAKKIVGGAIEIGSAIGLITGRSILALIVRRPMTRCHLASIQFQAGGKMISQGLREWKAAK